MKKPQGRSISVSGETHERLQQYAKSEGKAIAQVVEEWVRQYAPFTDERPKPRLIIVKEKAPRKRAPRKKPEKTSMPTGGGYHEF